MDLLLELLKLLGHLRIHAPELRPPAVVRLLANTQPSADVRHVHALPKIHISLSKQAHDLLCTASLLHLRTLSSPYRGTRILSQELDQDLGRGSTGVIGILGIVREDDVDDGHSKTMRAENAR